MLDRISVNEDLCEGIFRALFSTIFLGLGAEHLLSDELILKLMPDWLPFHKLFSVLTGVLLITGGTMIFLGFKIKFAAVLLGCFLVLVSFMIHLPYVLSAPEFISDEAVWLWDIYQRSNLVKNLCLLGVCFHLLYHKPGKYSLDQYFDYKKSSVNPS